MIFKISFQVRLLRFSLSSCRNEMSLTICCRMLARNAGHLFSTSAGQFAFKKDYFLEFSLQQSTLQVLLQMAKLFKTISF